MLKNGSKKGFLLVKMDFAFLPTAFIVYWILVHCRIGSLEISRQIVAPQDQVHCRIGSLEMWARWLVRPKLVHCRIGSLEKIMFMKSIRHYVHCRIGSLEKPKKNVN